MLGRPKFAEAARGGRALDYVEALRIGATMVQDPATADPITRDSKDDYVVRLTWASGARVRTSGKGGRAPCELMAWGGPSATPPSWVSRA